jgi:hypothetical protein
MQSTPLSHIRGDTFKKSLTITDGTNPINITGSTIKFTIKEANDAETNLVQVTATLTSPTLGEAQIIVSKELMEAVSVGNFPYDIEWTNATGERTTILIGTIKIEQDVS